MHMKLVKTWFMGTKAAIITNSPCLKPFGRKLGFTVLQFSDLNGNDSSLSGTSVDCVTSELLKLLGFQEGGTIETSQFDFVLVHIGAGERVNSERGSDVISDAEYVNALVGGVMNTAQPSSEISSRLHLSLVMSYGNVREIGTNLLVLASKCEMNSDLSMLAPCQSYTMKGEKPRTGVRHHSPMLIAQWQYAVTRMDAADIFFYRF
ncbi:uncharacterized protein LOC110631778 isoform X1 [Hevea brasiliensis]|uniref:uncharacterized protein LOC110631778 isoform X1 n=1 Tax=Hevea brasiliensis TaxID=3981 RepID=UPI000B77A608|nr:uncharacterized protein LOC110631778 isoform X1 [Hevea brasiliensis]